MRLLATAILLTLLCGSLGSNLHADSTIELERNSMGALSKLYRENSRTVDLYDHAAAILIFPEVHKIGAGLALQTATGVLFLNRRPTDYFNLTGFSVGLELGVQKYSCAIFFMDQEALEEFYRSSGFRCGLSGSLVIADELLGSCAHTDRRIQTFLFDQSGMMLSFGMQIIKTTKYYPSK